MTTRFARPTFRRSTILLTSLTLFLLAFALTPRLHAASFLTMAPEDASAEIDALVKANKHDAKTVNELMAALKSPDANIKVKERAAWALGQFEVKAAVPLLVQAAKHKGLIVRSAGLDALSHMRAWSGLPVFIDIANNDPILWMRSRATQALGLLRWEKAIQPLVKLSSDPTPEVRGAAALGMAALHSAKNDFSQALGEMASDDSPYVKERVEKALDVVHRKNAAVRAHLENENSDIRLFAAFYFHKFGTAADLSALTNAAAGEADDEARYEINQAIAAVKKRAAAAKKSRPSAAKSSKPSKKSHAKKAK